MRPRDYSNVRLRRYTQRTPDAKELAGLDVFLHIDSYCLGDTLCWGSFLQAFVQHHRPNKLFVSTFWPELFTSTDKIEFLDAVSEEVQVCDKFISGGYDKKNLQHIRYGMFATAKSSMLLPPDAQPDKSVFKKVEAQKQPNKIVIAPESLKKIARWDYLGNYGWQEVIDRLNSLGFEVHNISYENTLKLRSVISHHGDTDISTARQHICEARLFVGLGSGLAWLSWAHGLPVVMIAGFTKHFMEFPCYRVWNEYACNGCFNVFLRWNSSCPIFHGTPRANECHSLITPDMVMSQVDKALSCFG